MRENIFAHIFFLIRKYEISCFCVRKYELKQTKKPPGKGGLSVKKVI